MTTTQRYQQVLDYFRQAMPAPESELRFDGPYQLLVATMLAAQCTDKRVNLTTPALFDFFPDIYKLAAATPGEIYPYIKSISYPNNKARHLSNMAKRVVEQYDGRIPSDIKELQTLPGVGRKTANVVGAVAFGAEVMPVDTHVFRVCARIGLSKGAKTPLQCELQLVGHIPAPLLPTAHHWLLLHGRYTCTARAPKCSLCGIREACRYYARQGVAASKKN